MSAVTAASQEAEIIVNVKSFGAKGDGVTSDRTAIMSAFNYAISNYASKSIPVTVYFPEGRYGLKTCGMYIGLPYGSGNLTVKGDGADKSTIVYLDEWVNGGSWVALRLQLEEEPTSVDDYMHDITIQDMGVYDTDPVKHAWHPDKGDPGKEETHGFNIQHCVRATIRNCKVDSVGDEAIDMSHCIDSEMVDNLVINSPGAGTAGGGISVGDGSKNVLIARNTSIGSIDASDRVNWAIAVEALEEHIEDVIIEDNVIQGINGYGLNIGAPAGTIANVLVQNNIITDCSYGGIRLMGSGQTTNVQMLNNTMTGGNYGVYLEGSNKDQTLIENCVIENTTNCGIKIDSPSSDDTVVCDSTIRNSQYRAIYNAGSNTKIDHMLIDGVGLSGGVDYAILQYVPSGATTSCSEVSNTVILNCQSKRCIYGVQKVINTLIEQVETSGYVSIAKAELIKNCKINRIIQAKKGSIIDGLVLYTEANLGTHAITLSGLTDCTVTNGSFVMLNNSSRNAVCEINSADANIITNNVSVGGKGIKVIGANTVSTGNATGTYGTTDAFRYRIVEGNATIIEWLDRTATSVSIPAMVDGYPVTSIEAWAFALCTNLTTITIPDSITAIGANAFFVCDALTYVNYSGSEADWNAIAIGENNDALVGAARYNPAALYSDTVRHSVMDTENGNGLAFRFELHASGVKMIGGNRVDLSNATVSYYGETIKLVGMGAVVTNDAAFGEGMLTLEAVNGTSVIDVPTVYMQEVGTDFCAFATRVINIPDTALSRKVYARPYYVVEVDGEQIVVYGAVDALSCSDVLSKMLPLDEHYMNNVQTALPQYQAKASGSNLLTFTMMSDPHLRLNAPYIVDNVEASSAWANLVGNDFIMISGDFIIGDLDKSTSLGLIDTAIEAAGSYGSVPVYAVKGNHDTNEDYKIGTDPETGKAVYSTADRITEKDFYDHAIAQNEATMVTDPDNPYGGYYYVNFSKQKVRLICLNTTEIHSYVDILDSTKNDFRSNGALSFEQTTWLANTALQVPDGWAVMVVAHIPPITGANVGVENETTADAPFHTRGIRNASLTALLEAFVAKGKGSVTAKTFANGIAKNVSVSYDFTSLQNVEFIGHFSGHVHEDSVSQYNGITYVVVNCTTPQKRWDTSPDRKAGTETALSLNSFIVDRENHTVHCIKVGTGDSFSFTW